MPTADIRHLPRRVLRCARAFAIFFLVALAACSDNTTPVPAPAGIQIISGDGQYTRKGTALEDPVVVRVMREDGQPAAGVTVHFQIIEGGGSLSRTSASTSGGGHTSVNWTMGPNTGTNRIRISVTDNSSVNVVASATASDYYCPEEDPTFSQKFSPAHDLMLLTRNSVLTQDAGTQVTGLLRLPLDLTNLNFNPTLLTGYDEGSFINVVRDCVFAANLHPEVMKVSTSGAVTHFAELESSLGAEIAMTPGGVLVGCDEIGPFAVTCRDTIYRYEDAIFSGVGRDATNNDAVACDPASGSLYFIYKFDRWLYRIPLNGITQTGPKEQVVQLPIDESDGARGMVVDKTDGSVYILVESAATKSIVKVTSAGVKTTEFDFFSRGAGDAAGVQSDLAIDRQFHFLYTLDTKNNVVLLYKLTAPNGLFELTSSGDPQGASDSNSGERIGLDVAPGAGP
jgi:hypothetical protein